jgi:hypothetical protein
LILFLLKGLPQGKADNVQHLLFAKALLHKKEPMPLNHNYMLIHDDRDCLLEFNLKIVLARSWLEPVH